MRYIIPFFRKTRKKIASIWESLGSWMTRTILDIFAMAFAPNCGVALRWSMVGRRYEAFRSSKVGLFCASIMALVGDE